MHLNELPRPFVFDGAFGTYYAARSRGDAPCEAANLSDPETVVQIHREYIAAGAQAIKTNTFSCNAVTFPDASELTRLIQAGFANAQRAAEGSEVSVFADIGPIPDGESGDYLAVAEQFLALGAEYFLFETQPDLDPLPPVFAAVKARAPQAQIIVSFAGAQDGLTRLGRSCAQLLRQAAALDTVDAVGLNCICGPAHLVRLVREALPLQKPFSAMPNAGYPSVFGGRTVYIDNAEYYAGKLSELAHLGCAIVGGCCGTTPQHIRAFTDARHGIQTPSAAAGTAVQSAVPVSRPNPFRAKLSLGSRKVVAVELDPPHDNDLSPILEAAKQMKETGVDVLTFADSPLSRARADSMATAAAVCMNAGIPVMPHLACRDRNQIAIKGGLLAANALGVSNLLAVTGDPLSDTDRSGVKSVFSMNSYGLIRFVDELNQSAFASNPFFIGGALNLNTLRFDVELDRARKKREAGAQFFLTQPVFSDEAAEHLRMAHETLDTKILAGIFPVASYKNALFLTNEVAGIEIPDDFLHRLERAAPEEIPLLSVEFALEMAKKSAPFCDGFYLMTPLKRFDIVRLLAERILASLC